MLQQQAIYLIKVDMCEHNKDFILNKMLRKNYPMFTLLPLSGKLS